MLLSSQRVMLDVRVLYLIMCHEEYAKWQSKYNKTVKNGRSALSHLQDKMQVSNKKE